MARYGIAGNGEDDDFLRNPPPQSLVQNAARTSGQPAPGAYNAGGITPGSSMGPGAYHAADVANVNAQRNSGGYGVQTNTPSAWYGKGNEYGMSLMASDSPTFWQGYGDQTQGWGPGSNATAFYADKYNTQALGASLFGKGAWSSDEGKMAGQSAIADAVTAPGVQFFDPGMIIGNVMKALASGDPGALANQNPMLAQLLQSVQGNPAGQVETIVGFLKNALSAAMPPDTLNAFVGQLAAMGQEFTQELLRSPKMAGNENFASWLTKRLGPTLGL